MQGNSSAAPAGMKSIRIAMSTVTGRFMLKPNPTTTNYVIITVGSGFSSSQGCRGRDLGGIAKLYNLLLYNVAATSATLLVYALYELLAVTPLMLQDSPEDASLP